ncbi:EF-P lysine aminoacylase GenX [Candidatus Peregrinibacteria bacterium CG10_big_fil_rev_8_21_14_0_10_36_19]|nr:MAG: EF-P lysine aminoacylase GenX [Candidatus Peregrinibacteria bacterium CG10_big_fil_rev_8_21_14_0_10_36_19]
MTDKETIKKRAFYTQKIRDFFNAQNFTEVETPIMVTIPGMEPHLTPFETQFTDQTKLYLNHSPELQMKKLLAQGFGNIFNITKVFRNGEIGGNTHNPEFTMIEWYRENANYQNIMEDCEKLISSLAPEITYQGNKIDLKSPWPRKSVQELFKEYCQIDLTSEDPFKNHDTSGCHTWDDKFFKVFLNEIEPHLGKNKPLIVYDYPSSQAALAKKSTKNPFFAERFELYIAGIELANAFSELTDAQEQRDRLKQEQQERKELKKTVFPIDEEFLHSLESIQFPCAGIALGLDRLLMLLMDKKSINEVLLFPLWQQLQLSHKE